MPADIQESNIAIIKFKQNSDLSGYPKTPLIFESTVKFMRIQPRIKRIGSKNLLPLLGSLLNRHRQLLV